MLGLVLVLIVAASPGCRSVVPPPVLFSPADVAAALTQAIRADDKTAYDALFVGDSNAGSRAWTWQNLIALPQVSFTASPDDTLVATWRVSNDSGSATHHVGLITCADTTCGLADIGPQPSWPAPLWAVQPLNMQVRGNATVLAADGAATTSDWLAAGAAAHKAVQAANLGVLAAGWDGGLVIELPQNAAALGHLLAHSGVTAGASTGAFTWVENTGSPNLPGAVRTVVNPSQAGLSSDAQQLLITHEAVHVATANWTVAPGSLWVSEGLAESVAVAGDASAASAESDLAHAQCQPAGLASPSDDALAAGSAADQTKAYAVAQVLVSLIRSHQGASAMSTIKALGQGEPVADIKLANWSRTWCQH